MLWLCSDNLVQIDRPVSLHRRMLIMSLRKILADDLKWRSIGRMEAGQSQVEVAKWLNVNKSVVSKIWKQFIDTGTIKRKEGSGRKRKTATSEDRYLVVTAKRNREMTAIQLYNELSSATGTRISRQTVYRRLHEGALYARRPMVCIPLTSAHRRARLNCCLEHHVWTHDQWANVLFSDESRFSLNTDSRRVFIWREPGTRYHHSNIREIYSFRRGSLLVWAGISSSSRTPLYIFSGGTLTAQRRPRRCERRGACWTPEHFNNRRKINEVEKMILANRRITVREVAEDLNISIGSCHSIFINDLGMRRVAAKFVPKLLNCAQKQHRMNISNEILDSVRHDPNLLQRVITGDEAWVYGYDVETKAQSSQWKLPHEPRPRKTRQVRSNVKFLLTGFFDCRSVVHHEFLPQGRRVNKEYYLQVMRNLREAIRQKRPDLWKNKNWLLHHHNAPAHTSLLVRDFLAKTNTLMMPQPPYSPELAPCTFSCFLN
ncbi:hypothetical protein LAZ67_X002498 [Cordylochernes scorpioides]|uniref:Transposase Tc1-like domain-containing protein n=1 Tax=Cordylochernes scorpioides TaxID=51811 RepID=A0ABY6LTG5_9ARAC|nr:hypothetical protein LAZ67_X002498 [Cordylochernes scorpioides]